ncbi:MAG TPA: PASTA domain-containing protein, partial [Acidimicrobiia bacterium]
DFPPIGSTRTIRGRLGLPPRTAAQRARQRRFVPLVVLAAFAVATALGTAALAQVGAPGRATPSLVGLAQTTAAGRAKTAGLTLHVNHRASSDPKGLVISQSPPPGEWSYGGRTISVVVSLGPPEVATPPVIGLSLPDATAKLREAGLIARRHHGYSQTVAIGKVSSQSPFPGITTLPGTPVEITLSDGPPPVPVPDVHGETCPQATAQLKKIHLIGTCTQVFDDTTAVGRVVDTTPGPGTVQKQNTTVTIHVSKGPQLVAVPNVRGMKVGDATRKLQDLGFKVAVPNYNPKGHVFDQSPSPGQKIPKGSTVTLIL